MSKLLREINDWPERAVKEGWSVVRLAKLCKVSPSTLERHFQEEMGQCPKEWLNDDRMRRARALLSVEGSRVQQTATELNYQNQHHFSRAFKKYHGYPPSEHRKRVKQTANTERLHHANGKWRFDEEHHDGF